MKMKNNICLLLGALSAIMPARADWSQTIDFESETPQGYTSLSVYDCWEESPFRSGALSLTPQVTPNVDTEFSERIQMVPNPSASVAGAQRSRFGSNRFGLRIDLSEENQFELTPTVKYVHVKIHKPLEGRVMLVGLGSRNDVPDQNPYVEQFWVLSSNNIMPGMWNDAVFPIKGAGGITMRSLVVVPDCESPHNLDSDFLFYVDDIKVNDSSAPEFVNEYYGLSFDREEGVLSRNDRYSDYIELRSPKFGRQRMALTQQTDKRGYQNLLDEYPFRACPGESLTPKVNYVPNGWMHTYCYIDLNRDGRFDPEGGELVAYSYLDGKNSKGASAGQSNSVTMPAFTLPQDVAPGFYRIRMKVDWDCADPAGNTDPANLLLANGGVIADAMLNVVADGAVATVNDNQRNGDIFASEGSRRLVNLEVPAFEPFSVTIAPENGFENNGFTLKAGYGTITPETDDDRYDRFGNPNWIKVDFPLAMFGRDDNELTIPADYVFGTMLLEGRMAQVGTREPYYNVNFDKGQEISRTDRHLDSFALTDASGSPKVISLADNVNPRLVYVEKLDEPIEVNPGQKISPIVNYTGRAMHSYLYIDLNDNGFFTFPLTADGVPADDSELVSFTYLNGKNSKGQTVNAGGDFISEMPTFTLPSSLTPATYRARLKVDWDNADPAGRAPEDESNKIWENGGAVLDFTMKVLPSDTPGEDAISAPEDDSTAPDEVYDLQGRKVLKPSSDKILIINRQTTIL